MDKQQIWRIPKKYWELFETMSDEDVWKIIKCIFWTEIEMNWLTKTYYNIIKVDVENLNNSASWWSKWGRPKKNKTWGYEKDKPEDKKNNNQIKKREEKEREEKEKINKYIEENKNNAWWKLLDSFIKLWYKCWNLEEYRDWFKTMIIDKHNLKQDILLWIIDRFYYYWKEEIKKNKSEKNWKSTFINNFELKEYRLTK